MRPAQPDPLPNHDEDDEPSIDIGGAEYGGSLQEPAASNVFEMRADVSASGGKFAFKGTEAVALIALAAVTMVVTAAAAILSGMAAAILVAVVGILFAFLYLKWGR